MRSVEDLIEQVHESSTLEYLMGLPYDALEKLLEATDAFVEAKLEPVRLLRGLILAAMAYADKDRFREIDIPEWYS